MLSAEARLSDVSGGQRALDAPDCRVVLTVSKKLFEYSYLNSSLCYCWPPMHPAISCNMCRSVSLRQGNQSKLDHLAAS